MRDRLGFVSSRLERIKNEGLYRRISPSSVSGSEITIGGRRMVNMCSNDYLAIPRSVGAARTGTMQSSSRLLSGSDGAIHELESALAKAKRSGSALVFPTGYMANIGAVTALAGKGDCILSDELNHASIIDACRLSGAKTRVYAHNDMDDLEKKCKLARSRTFIVTEGTFSMDGDSSDARRICEIADRYGAVTILDDAHGDFALGPDGRGSWAYSGRRPDVYVSSMSKALGSFGGYVAADRAVVNLCTNASRTLIYTSAIPAHLAGHASARMAHHSRPRRQKKLAENAAYLRALLSKSGYETHGASHIIPIRVGGEAGAVEFSKKLRHGGVYAQAVRYPTVPLGGARIRLSVTAGMGKGQIRLTADAAESAGCALGII